MNVNVVSKHVRKQEWIERIQQCRSSGLSVRKWCERNAIPTPTYYYWLKRIRNEICDTITQNESVSFMPLIVETNEECERWRNRITDTKISSEWNYDRQ